MSKDSFEWDARKDLINQTKHGVSFAEAQYAFADPNRVIAEDLSHSSREKRFLLFWQSGRRHLNSAVHIQARHHPDHRSRLLAERETNL